MMSADSKNVYGNSRLQSPNLKLQGCAEVFRVKLGLCNLRFPYTFDYFKVSFRDESDGKSRLLAVLG